MFINLPSDSHSLHLPTTKILNILNILQILYLRVSWRSTHAADAAEIRKLTTARPVHLKLDLTNQHSNGFKCILKWRLWSQATFLTRYGIKYSPKRIYMSSISYLAIKSQWIELEMMSAIFTWPTVWFTIFSRGRFVCLLKLMLSCVPL